MITTSARAVKIAGLKHEKKMDKLHFRMHVFANSVTMIIIDRTMWITPYTNKEGNHAPSFVIDSGENPSVFASYLDYFDMMWNKALEVSHTYDITELDKQLTLLRQKWGV